MDQEPSIQITPELTPLSSSPKHFGPKTLAIIGGILLVAGIAYGAMWYWQKQQVVEVVPTFTPRADATADWKTYTNTQYGFEFKYPTKYTLGNCGDERVIYTDPICGSDASGDMGMSFEKVDFAKELSSTEAIYRQGINFTKSTIIVDGVSAVQFYAEFNNQEVGQSGPQLVTIFAKAGVVYSVDGYDKVLINQILATFKFAGQFTISATPTLNVNKSTKQVRVALILFSPPEVTEEFYTKQQVYDEMFTNTNSVKNFFEQGSFHHWSITGDVFGEYTIPAAGDGTCNYGDWSDQALEAAKKAGVNINNYTNFVFVFPKEKTGCTLGGWHVIGGNRSWVLNADTGNFTHELGHAFGLGHANALRCGAKAISDYASCANIEYGDPADVMGGSGGLGTDQQLFNAPHRDQLGWILPENIKIINTSGVYTLYNLETETNQTQVIKINKPDTHGSYYLEYRQPIGTFDGNLNPGLTSGVLVHIWDGVNETRLLDLTPENCVFSPIPSENTCKDYQFNNAALSDGASFTDTANGLIIKQLSHSGKSVSLDIKFTK